MSSIPADKLDEYQLQLTAAEADHSWEGRKHRYADLGRDVLPTVLAAYRELVILLESAHVHIDLADSHLSKAAGACKDDSVAISMAVEELQEARTALSADGTATARRVAALETVADKVKFCRDAHEAGHSLLAFAAWKKVVAALAALEKGGQA